jgi:hypothetical protein
MTQFGRPSKVTYPTPTRYGSSSKFRRKLISRLTGIAVDILGSTLTSFPGIVSYTPTTHPDRLNNFVNKKVGGASY